MTKESLNNKAWDKIFADHKILESLNKSEYYKITADCIRSYREPRLMTKFDHANQLPNVFQHNKLSILPDTRGSYIISHFEAHHTVENPTVPIEVTTLPEYIQSLQAKNISSETIALNCAFAAGILTDFLDDDGLVATTSGRMSSGAFKFMIHNTKTGNAMPVAVSNSQIEIDATYEGERYLSFIEAKVDQCNDFIIRQLYYPFRALQIRSEITKQIKPVFMVYSNGIFNLYQYTFLDTQNYNSIELVKQKSYIIEEYSSINMEDVLEIYDNVILKEKDPEVPFPQADSFERIINLCEHLISQKIDKEGIVEQYDFTERQADYYANAALYLGLIDKAENKTYVLSESGKAIMAMCYKERQLNFCKKILEHTVFHKVFQNTVSCGRIPTKGEIVQIMHKYPLYNIESEDTYERRASTISSWISWIFKIIGE